MQISRLRIVIYTAAILFGILAAAPNLFRPEQLENLPGFIPHKQVTLGLDLKGGSHLVLEVDAAALIRERLQMLLTESRTAMQKAGIAVSELRRDQNAVILTLDHRADGRAALAALKPLAQTAGANGRADIYFETSAPQQIHMMMSAVGVKDRISAATEQSLEIIRRRIDQVGIAEPTIQRAGADRIVIQLPGLQDPTRVRQLLGSTAKLSFHMMSSGSGFGGVTLPGASDGQQYSVDNAVAMAGNRLSDARVGFDSRTGQPVINFRLDRVGAKQFADITRSNVGLPFAIVLDGKVLSAPVINEPITGGAGQISGDFSVQEATDLSALLRAGALPARLTVIEERIVGADLGGDAIRSGLYTGLVGFALVVLFMFVLYGKWGLLANFSLALNVALTFGALSLMGATLTLPGIAGIVLGIGLAVDANVLINERIREETRKGARALVALDVGFKRAYATVVDSNVTALIATALLFGFGSGPVRGFAVTMGVGILISMFTAVSVVRVIMTVIVTRWKVTQLRMEPLFGIKLLPEGTSISFMKARYAGIGISMFLSLVSLELFATTGLNYGVDFKGGLQMEVATTTPLPALRKGLEALELGDVSLQEVSGTRVLLRAERQPGGEEAQSTAMQRMRGALQTMDATAKVERAEVIGPKVSSELASAGIIAVILASIAMLIYIWVRFEWPFAVGAIATLVLDVTKTVGFFVITGLEFNLTAIAALLTLIGYSVNDKVVVYDRMRENMRLYKKMPLRELIDRSINETLARSLYTSITAFLALLPMAAWGGNAVSSFAIPMLFGIAIAASSSVFIAAPILLALGDWRGAHRKVKREETIDY